MAFKDILALIGEEDERKTLDGLAQKYPNLRTLAEQGEQFQSFREGLVKAGVADPDKAIEQTPAMFKWTIENYDFESGKTKTELVKDQTIVTLQERITELEASQGGDMTIDEVLEALKKSGQVVTKEDLQGLGFATKKDVAEAADGLTNRFESVYAALDPLAHEHMRRFNEPLPMREVFEHMKKEGIADPIKGYESYASPKFQAEREAQHKAAVEAARKEGEAEGLRKAQEAVGRPGNPVDNGGSARPSSSFMQRLLQKRNASNGGGSGSDRLGSGQATRAGVADLTKRQMTQDA